MNDIIPVEQVGKTILVLRGRKVILDTDLARLYGVPTKAFNQAVKRNRDRFPEDFMFQLKRDEKREVVTNCDHLSRLKFSPVLPYAFTEHGAIMAATILNTQRAVEVSVLIVRAFVRMREALTANAELARKLAELERRLDTHDEAIQSLMAAIRNLMLPDKPKRRRIGFIRTEVENPGQ